MVVLILERVPAGLRGYLNCWMIEPHAGTFVGRMSARVRDELWDYVCRRLEGGSAVMVYSARNEQGFAVRVLGQPRRVPVDMEGITLIKTLK